QAVSQTLTLCRKDVHLSPEVKNLCHHFGLSGLHCLDGLSSVRVQTQQADANSPQRLGSQALLWVRHSEGNCWVSRGSSRIAGDRGNFCTWDQENQTVSQGKGPKKVQKKIPGKWQIL
ncbi:RIKEN cDNA 4930474M22, partial [Mus musculus]